MTIQEALSLAEHNIKANFGNYIPDASLATVQYLHWTQSLNLWARIKHLELLEERNNLSRESLLLIDPILSEKEEEEIAYYVNKEG